MRSKILKTFIISILLLSFQHAIAYTRPDCITQETWDKVTPYFLPEDHPIKAELDKLFADPNIIESIHKIRKAGFSTTKARPGEKIFAAFHKNIEGYLIKLYTDEQRVKNEWRVWISRIEGSKAVKEAIKKFQYQHLLKAPNKWIYPLSREITNPLQKNFILIAQDLKIYDREDNINKWKKNMTRKMLDAVYDVMEEVGLNDSVYADNIPFARDGRIAFVDTERHHSWPINYERLTKYMNRSITEYWLRKIKKK